MARKAKRYSAEDIARRVEAVRRARAMTVKAVAEALGIPEYAYYKKTRLQGSSFSLDELSEVADLFDAPPGWPFVEWREAER